MTRKELYDIIKKYDLNDEIIKTFGSDYTHVTNVGLEQFITNGGYGLEEVSEEDLSLEERLEDLEAKFDRLMEVLTNSKISEEEVDYINEGE